MEFASLTFILFVIPVLIIYWKLPHRFRFLALLVSSIIFIRSWHIAYPIILILSIGTTYLAGLFLEQSKNKKTILAFSIVAQVLLLIVFKYLNFFLNSVEKLSVFSNTSLELKILLPLGISYYIFQSIGYLVDIYRGKLKAEKNLIIFIVFIIFFPKFVAGPIERGDTLLAHLHQKINLSYPIISSGLKLFLIGAFEKLVVADNLAIVVDRVFDKLPEYKGLSLILIIFFYSIQIYADFSGYTNMARGVAKLFGINLLENFSVPYFSRSITEFWQRWHMSLSSWLKEYLYIPLGGNRRGLVRTCINLLFVFLICGLWHGAGWTFVIWGGMHGVVLIVERLFSQLNKNRFKVWSIFSTLYSFITVTFLWTFFRSETIDQAFYIVKNSLLGLSHFVQPSYISASLSQLFVTNVIEMYIVFFGIISIFVLDIFRKNKKLMTKFYTLPTVLRLLTYSIIILCIILFRNIGPTEFIYVQF